MSIDESPRDKQPFWLQPTRVESPAERMADTLVHCAGFVFLGVAIYALSERLSVSLDRYDLVVSLSAYGVGLISMIVMSAVYNIGFRGQVTGIWRRLDNAAIFAMIAGSYTPFAAIIIGGWEGATLIAIVWSIALVGMVIKVARPAGLGRLTVPTYLGFGWMAVLVMPILFERMSDIGLTLLIVGGLLYTVGTLFFVMRNMPFQNAVWHVFVLAAAICQFSAVMTDVAVAIP